MSRTARRCAICHRMLEPHDDGDYVVGRATHSHATVNVTRDLWLCEEHGKEVVKAIRAMAWANPWAKVKA